MRYVVERQAENWTQGPREDEEMMLSQEEVEEVELLRLEDLRMGLGAVVEAMGRGVGSEYETPGRFSCWRGRESSELDAEGDDEQRMLEGGEEKGAMESLYEDESMEGLAGERRGMSARRLGSP